MDIPEIDELLKADEGNVQTMWKFFADVNPDLPSIINEVSVLYTTCCRVFGQGVSEYARVGAPTEAELLAKTLQGLLLARISVLYAMAVADFLRMRVTTPLAHVRLQCESLALIKLMEQDSSIAKKWKGIKTEDDGKRFYQNHQKRLKAVLQSYQLASDYDRASSGALHSRFIGIARGFRISQREEGYRSIQNYTILAQEFDRANPHYFVAEVLSALRVQARILENIGDAAPQIADRLLIEQRIPQFLTRFTRFEENFKRQILLSMKLPS